MAAKGPAVGIDLGTTNSCVGIFQHGKVDIIANDQVSHMIWLISILTEFKVSSRSKYPSRLSITKLHFRVTVLLRPMLLSLTLNVWLVTPPRTKSPWTHQTLFSMPSVSLAENSMTLPSNQIWSTSPSMSSVMAVNQKSKLNTRVKTKHFSQKKSLQWFSTKWKRPLKLTLAKMFQMPSSLSQPTSTIHR